MRLELLRVQPRPGAQDHEPALPLAGDDVGRAGRPAQGGGGRGPLALARGADLLDRPAAAAELHARGDLDDARVDGAAGAARGLQHLVPDEDQAAAVEQPVTVSCTVSSGGLEGGQQRAHGALGLVVGADGQREGDRERHGDGPERDEGHDERDERRGDGRRDGDGDGPR